MLRSFRRTLATIGLLGASLGLVLFAAADDPTTNIPISCPESVSAGQAICGYASEYSPPIVITAISSLGGPIAGTTSPPFASGRCYFCYPTNERMIGTVVIITANDAMGQVGVAACLVTP